MEPKPLVNGASSKSQMSRRNLIMRIMGKHYDFLTENKEGQVVIATYNADNETYTCPGGFKEYREPFEEDNVTIRNLGELNTYVED